MIVPQWYVRQRSSQFMTFCFWSWPVLHAGFWLYFTFFGAGLYRWYFLAQTIGWCFSSLHIWSGCLPWESSWWLPSFMHLVLQHFRSNLVLSWYPVSFGLSASNSTSDLLLCYVSLFKTIWKLMFSTFASPSGSGLFRMSLECFAHLCSCLLSVPSHSCLSPQ